MADKDDQKKRTKSAEGFDDEALGRATGVEIQDDGQIVGSGDGTSVDFIGAGSDGTVNNQDEHPDDE
jgi:hypothetical protein